VRCLGRLADGRRTLELAIGTGRIALPLSATGLTVDGIDFSAEMVARLREKPGGDQLTVTMGDFADVNVADSYGLVFVVWNSFFNLLTQSDQKRCFANVARHLTPEGVFLIEAFLPSVYHRLTNQQQVEAEQVETDRVRIGVLKHDPARQVIEQTHVTLTEQGTRFDPVVQRYAWPAELDLMAELAGMRLISRRGGWRDEPFDGGSEQHVSVYGLKEGG